MNVAVGRLPKRNNKMVLWCEERDTPTVSTSVEIATSNDVTDIDSFS